jgi:hypothetical protein
MVLELSFLPMEASSTEGNGRMEHKSTKVVLISTTNFLTDGKNEEKIFIFDNLINLINFMQNFYQF